MPAGAELLISTDGGAECDSSSPNAYSYVAVEVQINGSFSGPSYVGLDRVLSLANNANGAGGIGGWALEGTSFPLAAGTYTVSVEAEGVGSVGASGTIVGGNLESFQGLIGNLTVTVLNA